MSRTVKNNQPLEYFGVGPANSEDILNIKSDLIVEIRIDISLVIPDANDTNALFYASKLGPQYKISDKFEDVCAAYKEYFNYYPESIDPIYEPSLIKMIAKDIFNDKDIFTFRFTDNNALNKFKISHS